MIYLPEKPACGPNRPSAGRQDKEVIVTSIRPLGTEAIYTRAPEGLSLSQILWNGPQPQHLPYVVEAWVDGKRVNCELFDSTYPIAGQLVVFKTLPAGNALRTILMIIVLIIAVAFIQPWLTTTAVGWIPGVTGATVGYIGAAAFSIIANLAINALIPPSSPKKGDFSVTNDAPTQWISGARNSANNWGTVPVVLGKHRTTPFYGTKPYTEIAGNDQYLRVLFIIGYGPLQITDLKLGEASIDTFEDVQIEIRSGWATDAPITLIPHQVDEMGLAILLEGQATPQWQSRTTEPQCDEFSIDWSFPSGLVYIVSNRHGTAKLNHTVSLGMRYRAVGTGEWTIVGDNLAVIARQMTFQSSWRYEVTPPDGPGYWVEEERIDVLCIRKDDGALTIFQSTNWTGGQWVYPVIDLVYYYKLADVTVFGDGITSIVDVRDVAYVTNCQVSLSSGLIVNVAAGVILNVSRLRTTAATTNALRRTLTIVPPARGQYEVEVCKLTIDSTLLGCSDKTYWIVLRSIRHENPVNFPHPLAMVALRIKATDQLSGLVDDFNCVATSIIKDYDTNLVTPAWVFKPSNNPASLYRHVLQGVANAKPVPDSKLDLGTVYDPIHFFEDFWYFCSENYFAFNAITASAKSVFAQCVEICSAGRCSPQRIEGKWGGVIDRPQAVVTGHYTPHNSWNLEFGGTYPDLPHGFRVAFLDETHNFEQQERIVYDDGYNEDNATIFESVAQQGVTDPKQIFRLWRYNIACAKLRPFPFSFMVDWEHLTNTRGDLIRVSYYELSGQLFTGRLKVIGEAGGNHVLTLDNPVMMVWGKNYAIRIRLQEGTTLTGDILTSLGEVSVITVNGLLAHAPDIGDLFQFGELQAESIPAIIRTIEPVDKLCARIECLDYAPAVFSAESELIPEWNPVLTRPYYYSVTPPIPDIVSMVSDESVIQRDPGGRFKFRIAVNFRFLSSSPNSPFPHATPQYVLCQYCRVAPNDIPNWEIVGPIPSESGILYIPDVEEGGQYQIRMKSITRLGVSSRWSNSYLETVVGRTSVPDNVEGFDYSFTQNGRILLFWDRIDTLDIQHYELRYGGTGWENATRIAQIDSDSYEWGAQAIGSHTVRIKAIDFLQLESENETTIQVQIVGPGIPTNISYFAMTNHILLYWDANPGSFPISHYLIYEGPRLMGQVTGTFTSIFESFGGTYTYNIKAVDMAGNESPSGSINATLSDPIGFTLYDIIDANLAAGTFSNSIYKKAVNENALDSLLHLNGANSSQIFKDEYGPNWDLNGNPQLSTADKKFGSASLELNGSTDRIWRDKTSLGGKFTVEGRFHTDNLGANQTIWSAFNAGGYGIFLSFCSDQNAYLYLSFNGTAWQVGLQGDKADWIVNTWYKWVVNFDGTTYRVYFGTSGPLTLDMSHDSTSLICPILWEVLGARIGGLWCLDGGIDEFRGLYGGNRYGSSAFAETGEFYAGLDGSIYMPVNIVETYDGHFTTGGWASWQAKINAGYPGWLQPTLTNGQYTRVTDFETIIPRAVITVTLNLVHLVSGCTIKIFISTSLNGTDWSSEVEASQMNATSFRYVKTRVRAEQASDVGLVELQAINLKLDVAKLTDSGVVSAVGTDTDGTEVFFNEEFADVGTITLTPAGPTPAYAVYIFDDDPFPDSFFVKVYDSAGNRITRNVSWFAEGI